MPVRSIGTRLLWSRGSLKPYIKPAGAVGWYLLWRVLQKEESYGWKLQRATIPKGPTTVEKGKVPAARCKTDKSCRKTCRSIFKRKVLNVNSNRYLELSERFCMLPSLSPQTTKRNSMSYLNIYWQKHCLICHTIMIWLYLFFLSSCFFHLNVPPIWL